jgi:zinc/manganese transport system substrate-binding protein
MTLTYRILWVLILLGTPLSVMSQENRLQIVASHSILGDVVQNVAGDVADVTWLIPAGADPHSFEPTPSDLTTIAKADLVFVNGAFFEEGLLESIENAGEEGVIIEASSCITIIELSAIGAGHDHDHDDDHNHDESEHDHDDHDHDDDHNHDESEHDHSNHDDHDEMENLCNQHDLELVTYAIDQPIVENDAAQLGRLYEIECTEGHADGGCDPHVWMNPTNAMYWVMFIRDTLINLDSANAETYTANAKNYMTELAMLTDDVIIPLVETLPPEKRFLITSHDSLGYFAATFGFETIGTILQSGSTVAEPSVQNIVTIVEMVRAEEIPAIFGETTVDDNIARTIADEAGVRLVTLHSGSLSDETGSASTYIDYLRSNYTAIIEALAGGS